MRVNELVDILVRLGRNDDIKIMNYDGDLCDITDILDLEDEEGTGCYVIDYK